MTDDLYDVIIIGGGPAGLSAAQYASRAKLKTVVLDKSPSAGALSYSRKIENYPGIFEPLTGKELLDIFREQAIKFGASYVETKVIGVKPDSEIKEIYALDKTYFGKTVIIATGSMGRSASISGEKEFIGRGVSYCAVCDAAFFKDRTVCVIGDNEEALKEALTIANFASRVLLVSPSKTIRISDGHPAAESPNLSLMTGYRALSIEGAGLVEKLRVRSIDSDEEQVIQTDGVFIYLHGNQPVVDFLGQTVSTSSELCVETNRMMETSVKGVYAAGDVTCVEVRQVVIAAANGCIAALSAEKYIHHRKRMKHDWAKTSE
ncbi:MAG: FAD-dependent oxidoreductase [Nitrospirae bacterium]|nr:FAD-dependent oxidoreductase [Nitrospirota bacterium]